MSEEIKDKSELFHKYINKYKDEVESDKVDGYYPANVVADAYSQGFKDGKNKGEKNFIDRLVKLEKEKFTQKANQIYILSQNIIDFLKKNKYKIDSLHISLDINSPKVILAVDSTLMLNDDFIELCYKKIFENKSIFLQLFDENLDIGIVSSENLNKKLLKQTGFGYKEEF